MNLTEIFAENLEATHVFPISWYQLGKIDNACMQ